MNNINNIQNNIVYFDNIQNEYIQKFIKDLETLKEVDYQIYNNQQLTNAEIIDLYKNLFVYFFFCTYDDYILMLRNSGQYIATSFADRYFRIIDNNLKYVFTKDRYLIVDSGYNILEDINNYEIGLKLNTDNNYLFDLKPIIKNNRLFYFIKYIGETREENKYLSYEDIQNIEVKLYQKTLIENNNILSKA